MVRLLARLAAAGLVAAALSGGLAGPAPAAAPASSSGASGASSAVATCAEAQTAYVEAQAKHERWQHRLARARKSLHQAHAHGTAAQFQQAKNRVRRAKAKVFQYRTAMDEAAAQVAALC
jgi:hypothetical protein